MPTSTLSQDIVAVCLLLADGNVDITLEDLLQRTERYQLTHDRHFGIGREDFRGLFIELLAGKNRSPLTLGQETLRGFVIAMLEYGEAYFNDEGNYWINAGEDFAAIGSFHPFTEEEFERKVEAKRRMRTFFADDAGVTPDSVREFLGQLRITDDVLTQCSKAGPAS